MSKQLIRLIDQLYNVTNYLTSQINETFVGFSVSAGTEAY